MRIAVVIVFAAAILGCAGCAGLNVLSPMGSTQPATANDAYVYGRFHKDQAVRRLFSPRLLLHYESADGSQHFEIELSTTGDVHPIRVAPGEYRLTQFVLAKVGGFGVLEAASDVARVPVSSADETHLFAQAFSAEPGTALYLGDFYGVADRLGFLTGEFERVEYRFDATTAELRSLFPAFSAVPTRPAWQPGPATAPAPATAR